MDDGVLGIEQHPIAKRHSFDFWRRITGLATGFNNSVGDGADMHAGTPGGNDHLVRKRRPARKTDRNDLFRLGVLERLNDNVGQTLRGP